MNSHFHSESACLKDTADKLNGSGSLLSESNLKKKSVRIILFWEICWESYECTFLFHVGFIQFKNFPQGYVNVISDVLTEIRELCMSIDLMHW